MKAIKFLMLLQLGGGLAAMLFAFGAVHTGSLGVEGAARLRLEFEQARLVADYREPPRIKGLTYSDVLDRYHSTALERTHRAGECFFLAAGVVVFSVVGLILVKRASSRIVDQAEPNNPNHSTS